MTHGKKVHREEFLRFYFGLKLDHFREGKWPWKCTCPQVNVPFYFQKNALLTWNYPFDFQKYHLFPEITLLFSGSVVLFCKSALLFLKMSHCFPKLSFSFPEVPSFYLLCASFSKNAFFFWLIVPSRSSQSCSER